MVIRPGGAPLHGLLGQDAGGGAPWQWGPAPHIPPQTPVFRTAGLGPWALADRRQPRVPYRRVPVGCLRFMLIPPAVGLGCVTLLCGQCPGHGGDTPVSMRDLPFPLHPRPAGPVCYKWWPALALSSGGAEGAGLTSFTFPFGTSFGVLDVIQQSAWGLSEVTEES